MKYLTIASILPLAASPALANLIPVAVPEIDAGSGTAVVAALGASVALLWERRRRLRR